MSWSNQISASACRVHEMSVPSPVNESSEPAPRRARIGKKLGPNVLAELESFIRTADDYDLFRVNPIQCGGLVDLSEADAIELFVHAAKVGLFEMDWLLVCAYCRRSPAAFASSTRSIHAFSARSATRSTMWRWTTTFRSPLRSRAACATSYSAIRKCCLSRIFTCATTFPRTSSLRTG